MVGIYYVLEISGRAAAHKAPFNCDDDDDVNDNIDDNNNNSNKST